MLHQCYKVFFRPSPNAPLEPWAIWTGHPLYVAYTPKRFTWAPLGGIFAFAPAPISRFEHYLTTPHNELWRCVGLGPIHARIDRICIRGLPRTADEAAAFWRRPERMPDERFFRAIMPIERIA